MAYHIRRESSLKLREIAVMLAVGAVCAAGLFGPELVRRWGAKGAKRKEPARASRSEMKKSGPAPTSGAALQPELAFLEPSATEVQAPPRESSVPPAPTGRPLVGDDKVQFRFSADCADRPLKKATGEPITPNEVSSLYGQELSIRDAGLDVCSSEYAARRQWPETKRPVAADLSKWESVRVAPGTVAIDPRLGRFKFSQGGRSRFEELGRVHIGWGEPNDVAIHGSHLFLALAESSFNVCIYDISHPSNPVKLGMSAHPKNVVGSIEWPSRIAAPGQHLYIPSRSMTVGIVDISDLAQPKRLTNFVAAKGEVGGDGTGRVQSLVADGQFLYVYLWRVGLAVWDVSNPSAPKQVGFIKPSEAFDNLTAKPKVKGKYLLFPERTSLLALDISRPSEPKVAGSLRIPCASLSLSDRGGDLAYLGCGEQGLAVVDVRDPRAMKLVAMKALSGKAEDVAAAGKYAFVTLRDSTGQRSRFSVVDVSNPAHPTEIGLGTVDPKFAGSVASDDPRKRRPRVPVFNADEINVDLSGIAAAGQHVFLADMCFGLRVFDVSDPRQPKQVSGFKESGEVSAIYTSGDYAYVGQNMKGGVSIVDVRDPAHPKWLSYFHTSRDIWSIAGIGNRYIYFSGYSWQGGDRLYALDVRDPARPKATAALPVSQSMTATVEGRYLYHGNDVYDLADPTQPKRVATLGNEPLGMLTVSGKRAYACTKTDFVTFDVSNPPSSPGPLGRLTIGDSEWFCHRIQVTDKHAYIPHGAKGVLVVDIANPSSPRLAASLPVKKLESGLKFFLGENLGLDQWTRGAMVALNLVGGMLYVSDYWDAIYAVDVSDPSNPKIREKMDAYYSWKMAIEGDRLYHARLDGLTIYSIPRPAEAPLGPVAAHAGR